GAGGGGGCVNLGSGAACPVLSSLSSICCDLSDETSCPRAWILPPPLCAPAGTAANSKAASIEPNAANPQNPFFIFCLLLMQISPYKFGCALQPNSLMTGEPV